MVIRVIVAIWMILKAKDVFSIVYLDINYYVDLLIVILFLCRDTPLTILHVRTWHDKEVISLLRTFSRRYIILSAALLFILSLKYSLTKSPERFKFISGSRFGL